MDEPLPSSAAVRDVTDELSLHARLRRKLLLGSGIALTGLAAGSTAASAQILSGVHGTVPNKVAPTDVELETFYSLSRLLTGHQNLDLTVGARLYRAMTAQDPRFPTSVNGLVEYARQGRLDTVESLEGALRGQSLHPCLMAIVGAWYSGVIEPGTGATVYAYERALMYQMSRDGMVIPTYAQNGPDYWVAEPPPLDRLPTF